jgi:AcrR family transcriptional regulator
MTQTLPRWKRQPGARPAQITAAALEVFAEHGYRPATMQDIAKAAGITKGTIYLYFSSKEELFIAVLREQFQEMLDLLPEINYEPGQDPVEVTRRVAGRFMQALMQPGFAKVLPLVIAEYNRLPQLKALYFEELLAKTDLRLAGLLEAARQLGLVKDVDPVIAARCFLGAFFAFVLSQEVLGAKEITPMDREAIVNDVVTILLRGLLREEAAPGSAEKTN